MQRHRKTLIKFISYKDVRPPNPPWIPLESISDNKAVLSIYYSDPLSVIPIRDISHKNDPKPDPNIETLTFGLFSTCHRSMRASIVRHGINLLFFCTNRGRVRVLTGYYKIEWYYKIPLKRRSRRYQSDDYILASKKARFVAPGFPLRDLTEYLHGLHLENRFRNFIYIDPTNAERLLLLLKDTPDATTQYISEIHRLEKLTLKQQKHIYIKRLKGFSWSDAPRFMRLQS